MKSSKGFVNIVILVGVALVAAIAGYIIFMKQSEVPVVTTSPTTPQSLEETVNESTITVLYPNGGERLESGRSYTVTWNSKDIGPDARIRISYRRQGLSSELGGLEIGTVSNTGAIEWSTPEFITIPGGCNTDATISAQYLVEVEWWLEGYGVKAMDLSNNPFTLTGPCRNFGH